MPQVERKISVLRVPTHEYIFEAQGVTEVVLWRGMISFIDLDLREAMAGTRSSSPSAEALNRDDLYPCLT